MGLRPPRRDTQNGPASGKMDGPVHMETDGRTISWPFNKQNTGGFSIDAYTGGGARETGRPDRNVPNLDATFALAWKHHQASNFREAELLYRQILTVDPHYADAWCFLGAVLQAQGKLADAEQSQRRAVAILP